MEKQCGIPKKYSVAFIAAIVKLVKSG